jgi:Uma2 family endonuclease
MNIAVRPSRLKHDLMGLKAFKRFTDLRPDEERWELRDGIPVMNATPTNFHQLIQNNIQFLLTIEQRRQNDRWHVFPGTNVVAATDLPNAPIPDVALRFGEPLHASFIEDIVVAFEIISPDSRKRDLEKKPQLYAAVSTLQHYVVVDFRRIGITVFDRATEFAPELITDPAANIDLSALDVVLPVKEIYRQTGLAK